MEFRETLLAAQRNQQEKSSGNAYYKARFDPPKKEKEQKPKDKLSANIQKFLAKKAEEEKQKELEAKRKRDELMAMRDSKAMNKIRKTLKVIKSANKSVLSDAIDNDNTAFTLGGDQPDQDDYGYESQEAAAIYKKMMEKYSKMPEESKFPTKGKTAKKDIQGTRERVRHALQHVDDPIPHKRRRRKEGEEREPKSASPPPSRPETEKKQEKPKFRRPMPPPMDFNQLLKLAEQKKCEPIESATPKKVVSETEPERPMTKKQRQEYEEERARKMRRLQNQALEKKGMRDERPAQQERDKKPETFNRIPKLSDKNSHRDSPKSNTDREANTGRDKNYTGKDRYPTERDRFPTERDRYPTERDRYPTERDRYPTERDRHPTEKDRYPTERNQNPTERNRNVSERDRQPTEKDRYPTDKYKNPTEKNRNASERDRNPTERDRPNKIQKIKMEREGSFDKGVKPRERPQTEMDRMKMKQNHTDPKSIQRNSPNLKMADKRDKVKQNIDLKSQNTYRIDKNVNEKKFGQKNVESKFTNGHNSQKPAPKLTNDTRNAIKQKMSNEARYASPRPGEKAPMGNNKQVPLKSRPEERKPDSKVHPSSSRPKISNSFDFDQHINSLGKARKPEGVKRSDDRKKPMPKRRVVDSEEDSDMDDFIDDGDQDEDYSKHIKEIFGYDKSKYRDEEDDPGMESSFAMQMREEYISKKIGIMEDLEDMKMEAMEKKMKAKKKRRIDD